MKNMGHVSIQGLSNDIRYVSKAKGLASKAPTKKGNPDQIEEFIWKSLCLAFESHVKINQLIGKGGENTRKKLAARVNQAIGKETDNVEYCLRPS